MKQRVFAAIACAIVLCMGTASAFAEEMPLSARLVEEPGRFDGTVIEFTGEAVGEVMFREGGAWVHLNDDAYMVRNVEEGAQLGGFNTGQAVWVPDDLARAITWVGDYHNEGDIVRVRGVFHAACAEHGGDMDIHVQELEIMSQGHRVFDPIAPWKPVLAFILAVVAAAAFGLYMWRQTVV